MLPYTSREEAVGRSAPPEDGGGDVYRAVPEAGLSHAASGGAWHGAVTAPMAQAPGGMGASSREHRSRSSSREHGGRNAYSSREPARGSEVEAVEVGAGEDGHAERGGEHERASSRTSSRARDEGRPPRAGARAGGGGYDAVPEARLHEEGGARLSSVGGQALGEREGGGLGLRTPPGVTPDGKGGGRPGAPRGVHALISHKVFFKSICKSQFPHKFVESFFI